MSRSLPGLDAVPAGVRLVACDLDGTLIAAHNRLTPRVAQAVTTAQEAGVAVLAATGRPWQWTLDIARRHHMVPTAVCSNGAALVDVDSGELTVTGFTEEVAAGLMRRVRELAPGVLFAIDQSERVSHEPGFVQGASNEAQAVLSDLQVDDLVPLLATGVIKIIARVPGMASGELVALLDEHVFGDVGDEAHKVAAAHGGASEWVELLATGVSKASGLAVVCDALGVAPEQVVAVGDGWNDVPMFEWAGTGVAVGNASDLVLDAADAMVGDAADDGVADLLEHIARTR